MTKLAIHGGNSCVRTALQPFNTIGQAEIAAVSRVTKHGILSGYMGGELNGGNIVQQLEDNWCSAFNCKHAIAVNSATSGLLVACMALQVDASKVVAVSALTMSASAAAPAFLGAKIKFIEIDRWFCADPDKCPDDINVAIVTNLFGHPAQLERWRTLADTAGFFLVEDNAQAPFAIENNSYAGTIGHIGVFSLNRHKHIQSGEGGMCCTDNDELAINMRMAINHAELFK